MEEVYLDFINIFTGSFYDGQLVGEKRKFISNFDEGYIIDTAANIKMPYFTLDRVNAFSHNISNGPDEDDDRVYNYYSFFNATNTNPLYPFWVKLEFICDHSCVVYND